MGRTGKCHVTMIDTLQATPQAMKLMDDLIRGHVELSPTVPKALYPLIRTVLRPALRFNYLSIVGLLGPPPSRPARCQLERCRRASTDAHL